MSTKHVVLFDDHPGRLGDDLASIIKTLEELRREIPECANWVHVRFSTRSDYGGDVPHLSVEYSRPETDQERLEREAAERHEKERREAYERAELARLKALYGETP